MASARSLTNKRARQAFEFPDFAIVAGHISYAWAELLSLATDYPNVFIDTPASRASQYPPERAQFEAFRASVEPAVGRDGAFYLDGIYLERHAAAGDPYTIPGSSLPLLPSARTGSRSGRCLRRFHTEGPGRWRARRSPWITFPEAG